MARIPRIQTLSAQQTLVQNAANESIPPKVSDAATENGKTVEIGRGVIDIPKFLKMLMKKGYQGVVGFEYEKDAEDPLPGLSESVGYVKGCLDSMG